MCSYCNSSFKKKHRTCKNNSNIGMMLIRNIVSWKKKYRCSFDFLLIFIFWHSRFSFRNLKDANSCMFSWFITTSSLLICSWYYATSSQFVQEMYSNYSKFLLFTSISCVQKSFKLTKSITDKSIFLYWWFSFDL